MKRRVPWILVALLFFAWSWGIFSDRFGEVEGAAGFPETSLVYLDRSLRMEEAVLDQPELIKNTLFNSDYDEMLEESRAALDGYAVEGLLDETGLRALAVIESTGGKPVVEPEKLDSGTRTILEGRVPSPEEISTLTERLASSESTWWDAKLAAKVLQLTDNAALSRALSDHREKDDHLLNLQLVCSALWWLFLFGGLAFIPHAVRVIRKGWTYASLHRPVRYGSRWEPSLIIGLLLAADLLAGYLIDGGYLAMTGMGTGFVFFVLMDSLWRLCAPAIALAVLFRKPSHAIRSLGLDTRPDWKLILAMYAVISWINFGFSTLVEPWSEFDPTGGLDPMEHGWGGLIYGLLSACILAPVAEEIFYRGILFRGLLRRSGFWFSSAVVTLAFVLAHSYDFFGLVTIGVFGFGMIVVYRTTGSLTTAIVLHAFYNFTITLPDWLIYHAGN